MDDIFALPELAKALKVRYRGAANRYYPLDPSHGLPRPKNEVLDRYGKCYVTEWSHMVKFTRPNYCIACLHYITDW